MKREKVYLYDTTLREGAQAKGVSFTVQDKVKIARRLDEMGIDYIEGGNPTSNPKDAEFFKQVRAEGFTHARLAAFGSTRRPGGKAETDPLIQALCDAETEVVAVFGKSWIFHVTDILRTEPEENLAMIYDSVQYLAERGREVVFDAEHFFDGYKQDPEYAIRCLKAAEEAGAKWLTLCDTNGGTLPHEVEEITRRTVEAMAAPIGIHCHNDIGCAEASSLMAVKAGARQVQCSANGYGERCANADLFIVLPILQLKMGYACVPEETLKLLTAHAHYISDVANLTFDETTPFVGANAFSHKGGMHIDAVLKDPRSYEHIDPSEVGNERAILMSEVAGRSTLLARINRIDPALTKESPETRSIIAALKEKEYEGYQYEGGEASLDLLILRLLGRHRTFFDVKDFRVLCEEHWQDDNSATAMIKVLVDGKENITAAEGNGPVNALDKALRKALEIFYPHLSQMRLTDFKVRILDSNLATKAVTRVQIESTDGTRNWNTVGVSQNIIEASWEALVDAIEYFLHSYTEVV